MKKLLLAGLAAGVLAIGCGGGGGSEGTGDNGGGGGGNGSANVRLFVTDAPINTFKSVWVTIQKIELTGPSGVVTVYDDPAGNVFDLATLSKNGVAQFALLGISNIPSGTYTNAKVTLDENVSLIPKDGGAALDRKFEGSADGKKVITVELENERLSNQDNLVIDFDLEKWNEDGTYVTAVVKKGSEDGLSDDARHHRDDYEGVVSGLTGEVGAQSFEIKHGRWFVKVVTTSTTFVYNSDGQPNATIANGAKVHVRGSFDVDKNAVVAESIKVKPAGDDGHHDEDEAEGLVGTVGENTFSLKVFDTEGFMPEADEIKVVTSASTRFFSRGGIMITGEEFYAILSQSAGPAAHAVEAEGTYDASTNTLTAFKVKFEDGNDDGDDDRAESEVEGKASNIDKTAHTFQVTVTEWEGVPLNQGAVLTVTVDSSTVFHGHSGGMTITMDEFFTNLQADAKVEVKGTLEGTTLKAQRVKLEDGHNS